MTSLGEFNGPFVTGKEFDAKVLFQLPHLSAQRGLRNVQLLGGLREIQRLGDGKEITDVA